MLKRNLFTRSKKLFSIGKSGVHNANQPIVLGNLQLRHASLYRQAKHSWSRALTLMIPNRCGLCQCISDSGFCQQCQDLLPWIKNSCRQCGTTIASGDRCGRCQNTQPEWQETIVPFHYIDPVSSLIHQFKYREMLSLAPAFCSMLASTIIKRNPILPDILIPVPMHDASLQMRGYNQSAIIAKELGKRLELPVEENAIIKSRKTKSQMQLSEKARYSNVCGAFNVVESVTGVSVAIVDDVITSGATVREVCKALRISGCDQLSVWAIAKTKRAE